MREREANPQKDVFKLNKFCWESGNIEHEISQSRKQSYTQLLQYNFRIKTNLFNDDGRVCAQQCSAIERAGRRRGSAWQIFIFALFFEEKELRANKRRNSSSFANPKAS